MVVVGMDYGTCTNIPFHIVIDNSESSQTVDVEIVEGKVLERDERVVAVA